MRRRVKAGHQHKKCSEVSSSSSSWHEGQVGDVIMLLVSSSLEVLVVEEGVSCD